MQREIICEPVADQIEEYSGNQLQPYFLANGLFYPDAKIRKELSFFEKNDVWSFVQKQYEDLKKQWGGADAAIFLFPVETRNELIMNELKGKMGVSFHGLIVLFLSHRVEKNDLRAILTHEYNHVCRLANLNKEIDELSLLDSMLIEGMAELAVEETVGVDYLAPWVSLYPKEELQYYWSKLQPLLHMRGKTRHDPILYGDGKRGGYPKWLGYCLGYEIVKGYVEQQANRSMEQLLNEKTATIVNNSTFKINYLS